MQRSAPSDVLVATHNAGKLREFAELLEPLGVTVHSAAALNLPEPEETGETFAANALLKAQAAASVTRFAVLADDSGLAVEALDGAPGIYSARWGGKDKDFNLAMRRVEQELRQRGVEPEGVTAKFVCAIALVLPERPPVVFEGVVRGTLTFPPRGEKGFGYDPIFVPEGDTRTFAEIAPEEKQAISHRAHAFSQLCDYWRPERLQLAGGSL